MVIATFGFSFASDDKLFSAGAFYAISYISRLIQGIADAQICVALFSITSISFNFTNEPAKYLGIMQGSLALGMLLGPCISAAVYVPMHYWGTFLFYGCTIFFFGLGAACLLPNELNDKDDKEPETRAEKLAIHQEMEDEQE